MAVLLGIDTGGTYTDAVLVLDADDGAGRSERSDRQVVASAKAPTTHHELTIGVAQAVRAVLQAADDVDPSDIDLVSVSTTLATNAIVEGHGEPAGLVAIGFTPAELDRVGLEAVIDSGHLAALPGGHDAHGNERAPFPEAEVLAAARAQAASVSAFAVVSQFSVRNPDHERRAVEAIRSATGLPVTASHELSARLDGPRRALTAALNARLLGTIDRLNRAVEHVLDEEGIDAPLMVVRGDGSLVSSGFAAERPIETVLSGPAASVVGALHLAGLESGLVADIGGTTTDLAVIRGGRPTIAAEGAVVGGHRTMVEAVDMATIGLGGDSEVRIDTRDRSGPVLLGPERAIPICRLAQNHPVIREELERQLNSPIGLTNHGRFLVATVPAGVVVDDRREQQVLERLADGPMVETTAAPSGLDMRAAVRLRRRGLVRVATLTPTDASAVVRSLDGFDTVAAALVAQVLARQTSSTGGTVATDGASLCAMVIEMLERRSASFAVQVALRVDGIDVDLCDPLLEASLDAHAGAAAVTVAVNDPIVAIGAPAAAYYPAVARLARTSAVVPNHAGVANAVGAVVGRVRVRRSCTITQPTKGQFRVHLDEQPSFGTVANARGEALARLERWATNEAEAAGASAPELRHDWSERVAVVEGKEVFVEGTLTVEAAGRPRF